jgi:hypothetical protein
VVIQKQVDGLGNFAIMPSTRQFGYKRGNLSRLNSVGWLPKTIFALRRANLLHNLRYRGFQKISWWIGFSLYILENMRNDWIN